LSGSLTSRVVVDPAGIAFVAARLALDKQPVPTDHVVIRDEERGNGTITALRYRVSDFTGITASLNAIAPGTDRLDYARSNPSGEPQLISLTLDQVAQRIPAKKILAPLTYFAERIYVVEGQIEQIHRARKRAYGLPALPAARGRPDRPREGRLEGVYLRWRDRLW